MVKLETRGYFLRTSETEHPKKSACQQKKEKKLEIKAGS